MDHWAMAASISAKACAASSSGSLARLGCSATAVLCAQVAMPSRPVMGQKPPRLSVISPDWDHFVKLRHWHGQGPCLLESSAPVDGCL